MPGTERGAYACARGSGEDGSDTETGRGGLTAPPGPGETFCQTEGDPIWNGHSQFNEEETED